MTPMQKLAAAAVVAVAIGAGGVAVLKPGGVAVGGLDAGALQQLDAGVHQVDAGSAAPFKLPDGGPWALAPAAAPVLLGACSGGQADVATATGYARVSCTALADGGYTFGVTALPFTCACATDAGPCHFSDGGQVGAGTYAASAVSGAGCALRVCGDISWAGTKVSFSGAPAGCAP
jgi:hypothetical protein